MTDIHVVCQKMTRNGRKMAKLKGSIFYIESEYMYLENMNFILFKFVGYVRVLFYMFEFLLFILLKLDQEIPVYGCH